MDFLEAVVSFVCLFLGFVFRRALVGFVVFVVFRCVVVRAVS